MKTQIKRIGDTVIVSMEGKLDFETHIPLRENLDRLIHPLKNTKNAKNVEAPNKIIFNLENLEFVGSSGISAFIQALQEFNSHAPSRPRYCNVGSEFRQIIKAFDELELFDFYEDEEIVCKSFDQ